MSSKSVVGAGSVVKEERQERQCASDVHIGIIFGGVELSLAHSGHIGEIGLTSSEGLSSGCSLFVEKCVGGSCADVHNIYVGGCGEDLFSAYGSKGGSKSVCSGSNGDVILLLSKAVKSVKEYLDSLTDVSPDTTTLHFYVVGLSYGASCARLFCHMLLRGKGGNLKYEHEFQKYKAKTMFVNGRLKFLEEYQDKQKIIDALGLYDTETSTGYLVKKDGTRWMCMC